MKKNRKIILVSLSIILVIGLLIGASYKQNEFKYWNIKANSLATLKEYVKDVTNKCSKNYIPEEDRIAVFDMDGTIYGEKAPIYVEWYMYVYRTLEDPSYKASEELKEVANEIVEASKSGVISDDLEYKHAIANAEAFSNMTIGEYRDYVKEFLSKDVKGFEGMKYSEAFFLPMIQVIDYLNKNNFTVYICSGTDRFMCRTMIEGIVDIPKRQVIGMDVLCLGKNQGETDGLDYVYTTKDDVVRSNHLIIKNVKANKVSQIIQEIGAKPVLSFGNSSGDTSMAIYTTSNNPYRSMAFMVVADDVTREYGDESKAKQLHKKWDEMGWTSISMKDDWNTIYGQNVIKTSK